MTIAVTMLNDLLKNELVMSFVNVISQVGAFGLAIGTMYKSGKFVFDALLGTIGMVSGGIGKAQGALSTLFTAFTGVGGEAGKARASIGGIGKGIAKGVGWAAVIATVASGISKIGQSATLSETEVGVLSSSLDTMFNDMLLPAYDEVGRNLVQWKGLGNVFGTNNGGLSDMAYALDDASNGWMNFGENVIGALTWIPGMGDMWQTVTKNSAQIKELGTQLGTIAKTNFPAAATAFKQLGIEAGGTEEDFKQLLNAMPDYKAQLVEIATANGIATDEQSLYNLAMGKGEAATRLSNQAFANTSAAAYDASGKVQGLADKIRDYTNAAFESTNTEMNYQQALDDLTASLTANGSSFDVNEQAGRNNMRALQELATANNEAAAAAYEQDGDVAKLTTTMEANRQQMIDTMVQAGMSEEAAKGMVDQYMMTPEQIATEVKTKGVPESKQAIKDVQDQVAAIPETKTITMNAKTGNGWTDFWGSFGNFVSGKGWGVAGANGMLHQYMNGGIQAYANGGMRNGIYKGRAGGILKFAEPETGWEAFISGKRGQEKRNIEIWKEAGKRLGVISDANATGGLYGLMGSTDSASSASTSSKSTTLNNIAITVNPAPGMNEKELASAVSRELAFQMRMGGI